MQIFRKNISMFSLVPIQNKDIADIWIKHNSFTIFHPTHVFKQVFSFYAVNNRDKELDQVHDEFFKSYNGRGFSWHKRSPKDASKFLEISNNRPYNQRP